MLALAISQNVWAAWLLQVVFLSLWGVERLLDVISHIDKILGV